MISCEKECFNDFDSQPSKGLKSDGLKAAGYPHRYDRLGRKYLKFGTATYLWVDTVHRER